MPTDAYVIATENLTKTYQGVAALQSLSLRVPKNSIFGFLGPNGAGKTTTIRLLLGLARPTGGSATVFGHDIGRESTAIRKRVGYLAQEPRYYEHLTARETLRFTLRFFFSGPREKLEARIDETLALVGLDDKADRPIRGFSGGERQRLGIAQAQINYPDLLILDEPAASLDPMGRRDVLEVMERLRKYTTIFYSTHILSDVQRVSDTVAILSRGRLVAEAPIGQLLAGSGPEGSVAYAVGLSAADPTALAQAQARLLAQPWVQAVEAQPASGPPPGAGPAPGDGVHWYVSVTDAAAAEDQLLRLVLDDRAVRVTAFGQRRYDLEEVFLSLVEGSANGR
jgi:ABC-2 type transport system ATP-binding protein